MGKLYVHFGCGLTAPKEWINFDTSPTLRIQKTPLLGKMLKKKLKVVFPSNVRYGDIVKGLPIEENSCEGLYCSHIFEHLSLKDIRIALKNSYKILKSGGTFRCIVPDLEFAARKYINELDRGNTSASLDFIKKIKVGRETRPKGLHGFMIYNFGNSPHLWMWDHKSLSQEFINAGFINIRNADFGDSNDPMFKYVENVERFKNAVAIECSK